MPIAGLALNPAQGRARPPSVLGAGHLDRLAGEYANHYNRQRPHSRLARCTPAGRGPPGIPTARGGGCQERLGGVVRHYYRRAG